ncbi:acetyl-diaminopimelate aminotransferase [Bacillus methanolicus PB1]|uniref:Aminotransferase n=1 Tax=Bacillus methanolicus PB1 TaxID=997296 RepID=I3E5C1_BACMT|nr:aminotransferase A [Bacillus methanolicus]EIJ81692.1 acetyl-diaminopimelate aminotransferase [Bacillus methanolicus PB1]
MEHLINDRTANIEISGIRKFFNMVGGTEGMISLTIGQPDFPTPEHVKAAGIKAIHDDFTMYTHNAGMIELRKAAAEYYLKKYDIVYDPDSEVIITSGASEAIDIAFRTILDWDSEVILPGPVYPGYEPIIRLCGAKPIYADTTRNGFKMTVDVIKPYITNRTRCIVLPYPSNPTGVSLSEKELYEISELLRDKDIFILADEIYSEIVYERPHTSIAKFLKEKTIVINGLSKSHSMTGWRIGMLYTFNNIAKHIIKVHQYNVTCATSISQMAALEALTAGIDDALPMRAEYRKRRDYVYNRLTEMGFDVVKPEGAFYFFVKIPVSGIKSFDFALSLAHEAKVAVVPGSAFSSLGEGYFRLSFAYSMDTLEEGLNRIENYLMEVSK